MEATDANLLRLFPSEDFSLASEAKISPAELSDEIVRSAQEESASDDRLKMNNIIDELLQYSYFNISFVVENK